MRRIFKIVAIILLLVVDIIGAMLILSFIESQTVTPEIHMISFEGVPSYEESFVRVSAKGTVINPGPLVANNVTVLIEIYVRWASPYRGVDLLETKDVDLGRISGNSSKDFSIEISIPKNKNYQFNTVGYDLLLASGFGFGTVFFAAVLPIAVTLSILNIYCAHLLGFFGWVKARKKAVATTIAWSAAVAFMIIKSYWLVYMDNPLLFSSRVVYTDVSGRVPQLNILDWGFIFVFSMIAGAVMVDLETTIYSVIASVILSFVFAVTWAVFFIWFSLGMSESLAIITPEVSFLAVVESVIQAAFMNILRMVTIIVPMICFLGVFAGAFTRAYFQPSAES